MAFNLDDYEPVQSRFARFIEWAAQRDQFFAVTSEMLSLAGADICVFKTSILCDGVVIATGHAEEVRGAGHINKVSHVENCETSSLGRCLSNFPLHNFAGTDVNKRPSREEMQKVQRSAPVPTRSIQPMAVANGITVKGNQFGDLPEWLLLDAVAAGVTEVYDNRADVAGTKRPWFKATTGGKDAKAFWPPKGTPDPVINGFPIDETHGDEEPF